MKQRPSVIGALCLALFWLASCGSVPNSNPSSTSFEDALFWDNFTPGETGDWFLEADDGGSTAVINQELVIAINQPNTLQFTALQEQTFTDFVLEVDTRQIAGSPESSFGVLLRMQNNDQFYRFDITGSGLFMVERRDADGRWTQFLDDWTASDAINQGFNVPNRLKVVAQGSKLSFFANDILLHQIDDVIFPSGGIALDAGTFGQGDLQVAFDNLVVRAAE